MIKTKPFPWTCVSCGTKTVMPRIEDYNAEQRYDGKPYSISVPNAEIPTCTQCGGKVLTDRVNRQISAALRTQLGLLTPEEIKTKIEMMAVSQKAVAALLRISPESVSRWISGSVIQTRSMDTMLRLLFDVENVRGYLARNSSVEYAVSVVAERHDALSRSDRFEKFATSFSGEIRIRAKRFVLVN